MVVRWLGLGNVVLGFEGGRVWVGLCCTYVLGCMVVVVVMLALSFEGGPRSQVECMVGIGDA